MAELIVDPIYLCPITREIMLEPVVASDGFTYEQDEIIEYMKTSKLSPITREELNDNLYVNICIKNKIGELLTNNPELKLDQYRNFKFKNNKSDVMLILTSEIVDLEKLKPYYLFDLTDVDFYNYFEKNINKLSHDTLCHLCNNILAPNTFAFKANLSGIQKGVLKTSTIDTIDIIFSKLVCSSIKSHNYNGITLMDHNTIKLSKFDFVSCLKQNKLINYEDEDTETILDNITNTLYQTNFNELKMEVESNNIGNNIPFNIFENQMNIPMNFPNNPLINPILNLSNINPTNNCENKSVLQIAYMIFWNIIAFLSSCIKFASLIFRKRHTNNSGLQMIMNIVQMTHNHIQSSKNLLDLNVIEAINKKYNWKISLVIFSLTLLVLNSLIIDFSIFTTIFVISVLLICSFPGKILFWLCKMIFVSSHFILVCMYCVLLVQFMFCVNLG